MPALAARCSGVSPSSFRATSSSSFLSRTSPANAAWPCRAARWSAVLSWGVVELRALESSGSTSFLRLATFPSVAAL